MAGIKGLLAARNLLKVHPGTPVDLVVQGNAVTGLVAGSTQATQLAEHWPKLPNGRILACRNALGAHDVAEDTLAGGVEVVPAGGAHLAQRQWEGWAYLRV
ncbi:MAG: DsrE family protein [Micrococcales bacterium]|nr:DsrE family protein [Micrococcales bacterium]